MPYKPGLPPTAECATTLHTRIRLYNNFAGLLERITDPITLTFTINTFNPGHIATQRIAVNVTAEVWQGQNKYQFSIYTTKLLIKT